MIQKEEIVKATRVITSVVCDITKEICPQTKNGFEEFFDFANIQYHGSYGSEYDLLDINLQIHPGVVYAMYLNSLDDELRQYFIESYGEPEYSVSVEKI
jgi:hypothetical protein